MFVLENDIEKCSYYWLQVVSIFCCCCSLIYHFILMGLVNFNLLCKTKWTHSKPSAQSFLFLTLLTKYICYYYLFINVLFRCPNFHNNFFPHSNTHHIVGSVFYQFFFFFETYLHKIIYFTYWIHILMWICN